MKSNSCSIVASVTFMSVYLGSLRIKPCFNITSSHLFFSTRMLCRTSGKTDLKARGSSSCMAFSVIRTASILEDFKKNLLIVKLYNNNYSYNYIIHDQYSNSNFKKCNKPSANFFKVARSSSLFLLMLIRYEVTVGLRNFSWIDERLTINIRLKHWIRNRSFIIENHRAKLSIQLKWACIEIICKQFTSIHSVRSEQS